MRAHEFLLIIGFTGAYAAAEAGGQNPLYFAGACDASAAVALNDDLFVVANDEDNVLRVYSRRQSGLPISQFDFTAFLRPEKKSEESDLEAAAQVGERIYWISSHGRNAKGKERETRHRFFATTASVKDGRASIEPIGSFYSDLVEDMARDARLRRFDLRGASALPPKTPGGLNIEGLAAAPEGHLLVGFRNPVPEGKALLLPLLNRDEVIEGKRARFGEAILLQLHGLGIRSMASWREGYIIVAGPIAGEGESFLYRWVPGSAPQRIPAPEIRALNPEAVAFFENGADLLLLSDDGTARIGAEECKAIKDPRLRKFRGVYLCSPLER
jgi:hypothetical protein